MVKRAEFSRVVLAIGLPGLLFVGTYFLLGFHYETNDDLIISLLLRGIIIQPPLSDLSLYFHGLSHGLVWLYRVAPLWPWYGLLLYLLLYVTTVLAFWFLLRPRPDNRKQVIFWFLWLVLASWLEHLYWFNYLRVPLLLAGMAYLLLLVASARANNQLTSFFSGLLLVLALCIRPSAALLGFAVVGPATFLVHSGRFRNWYHWRLPGLFGGISLVFFTWLHFTQSPAQKNYQRLDWLKSTVLDFDVVEMAPQTTTDSAAVTALNYWVLADTQVVNQAFYARAGQVTPRYILKTAPAKLKALVRMLIRDHFLVLTLNIFLFIFIFRRRPSGPGYNRRLLLLYQVYFWVLMVAIGLFMKLPPRIITPCLSLYTLVNLFVALDKEMLTEIKAKTSYWAGVGFLLLAGLQGYKIYHRAAWQNQNQAVNEALVTSVSKAFRGGLMVTNVLPDFFRSLSPFQHYNLGTNSVLLLTGWPTLDPGYQHYYFTLTGQTGYRQALSVLARQKNTVWVLSPGFYPFLNTYLKRLQQPKLNLQPWPHSLTNHYPVEIYRPPAILPAGFQKTF